jgi:hypothetical protein
MDCLALDGTIRIYRHVIRLDITQEAGSPKIDYHTQKKKENKPNKNLSIPLTGLTLGPRPTVHQRPHGCLTAILPSDIFKLCGFHFIEGRLAQWQGA